ncbi:hypothetical protein [Stieleria mannarensis]|uniref:hypothetical protein n=1 Tax=Stieleria mannarensis TaxID=2755585 RepID=UPI001601A1EF|nr:hypothetical protein [Rhodopirellula sp. JC639]
MQFRLASLMWLACLVAVFFGARSPLFDFVFASLRSNAEFVLGGGPILTSQSDPKVVDLSMIDPTTCVLIPKKAGMSLVEFQTPKGIEAYIVSVSPMMNVRFQRTEITDGVSSVLSGSKSIRDVMDEAFGPAEP